MYNQTDSTIRSTLDTNTPSSTENIPVFTADGIEPLPVYPDGTVNCSSWLPFTYKPTLFDHWPVPCVPRHRLPGMAFLSPKAALELKHGARGDELLPGDRINLQFVYAKILYDEGDVTIQFPSFYKDAHELKGSPISKTVGKDCSFFFELGDKLCEVIPEFDWPIPDLRKILATARNKRFVHLQMKKHNVNPSFLSGMTYKERKMYNRIADCDNALERGNKGTISLHSFLDSIDYFNRFS
ncbi:putative GINS complex subunit Psf3 [Cardiosporidium cionae]|uniref:GINS complex subunit Psf3 n=1 Tax=Cardiosporidium cionae TaxID=476202 RepID=A0ABQ7JF59_9APIC|nr:putative GINS complex subunit Psf3 [Cardiosporidium cionae]|eukprot:KAF8822525.1 putative GINS complex subunit Psf3 [Cardiosporidium cionae]